MITQEPTIILQGITVDELVSRLLDHVGTPRVTTKSEQNFNLDEVAQYLRVHPQTVHRLKAKGKIPFKKVAGRIIYPKSAIDKWINENT